MAFLSETPSEYEGSKRVTCKEASALMKAGKAIKAWYRPDGLINYQDPDSDLAFVWEVK